MLKSVNIGDFWDKIIYFLKGGGIFSKMSGYIIFNTSIVTNNSAEIYGKNKQSFSKKMIANYRNTYIESEKLIITDHVLSSTLDDLYI
jgi:hypothetical protein